MENLMKYIRDKLWKLESKNEISHAASFGINEKIFAKSCYSETWNECW